MRRLIGVEGAPWECVWTGRTLDGRFEVDHASPYSVWGNNDRWNLLPCLARVNRAKSDALPTRQLLVRRRGAIVRYWGFYESQWEMRLTRQMHESLGSIVGQRGWERQGSPAWKRQWSAWPQRAGSPGGSRERRCATRAPRTSRGRAVLAGYLIRAHKLWTEPGTQPLDAGLLCAVIGLPL